MVGHTSLKERGERWSPNNFMQSLSVFCFLMTKKNTEFSFNPWLLNFFDLPSYGSELMKRYTLRLFLMCLEEKRFWSCSAWGNGGQMAHFVDSLCGKVCLGRAKSWRKLCKLTIKWASSKTVSDESADTSCTLSTGCFLDTIYWIAVQKMHISEYVCKIVLKSYH